MEKLDRNASQKLVSFVFIALMLGSIFTGAVSADIDNVNGSSLVNESYTEWASKPVIVNVQVDLENEGDQFYVSSILDEVEKQGYTTVFVTGEFASLYPDVVKEIEARGHEIAVHGWRKGENLTLLNYEEQLNLIQKSFLAVRSAVNNPEKVVDFKPQRYKFNNDLSFRLYILHP